MGDYAKKIASNFGESESGKKSRRERKIPWFTILLLIVLLGSGWYLWGSIKNRLVATTESPPLVAEAEDTPIPTPTPTATEVVVLVATAIPPQSPPTSTTVPQPPQPTAQDWPSTPVPQSPQSTPWYAPTPTPAQAWLTSTPIPQAAPQSPSRQPRYSRVCGGGTVPYKVGTGETLSGIAGRYGTTASNLASLNNIGVNDMLFAGEVLCVPGGGTPAQATAVPKATSTPVKVSTSTPVPTPTSRFYTVPDPATSIPVKVSTSTPVPTATKKLVVTTPTSKPATPMPTPVPTATPNNKLALELITMNCIGGVTSDPPAEGVPSPKGRDTPSVTQLCKCKMYAKMANEISPGKGDYYIGKVNRWLAFMNASCP